MCWMTMAVDVGDMRTRVSLVLVSKTVRQGSLSDRLVCREGYSCIALDGGKTGMPGSD
ncbi:MAG: hypothetical protein LKE40_04575 [Spirochaetia bacterium]|nr:hypothetical protein [Spirochaetia bacterium]